MDAKNKPSLNLKFKTFDVGHDSSEVKKCRISCNGIYCFHFNFDHYVISRGREDFWGLLYKEKSTYSKKKECKKKAMGKVEFVK